PRPQCTGLAYLRSMAAHRNNLRLQPRPTATSWQFRIRPFEEFHEAEVFPGSIWLRRSRVPVPEGERWLRPGPASPGWLAAAIPGVVGPSKSAFPRSEEHTSELQSPYD